MKIEEVVTRTDATLSFSDVELRALVNALEYSYRMQTCHSLASRQETMCNQLKELLNGN